jgi:hypothetical protein
MNSSEDDDHDDDDHDDDGNDGDDNINSVQSILTFFTCLPNCPYATYKVSRSIETQNQTQTHIQKTKQDVYNLDSYHSISAITPALVQ